MQTTHPHTQSLSGSILDDACQFARAEAEEYANAQAEAILPIIMPYSEWIGHWDFAWNSAFNYATEGVTTAQLLGR